jgi:hypothetical protein
VQAFLASSYFGDNAVRAALNNDAFHKIEKDCDLVTTNVVFLRNLPNLKVLEIEQMFEALEQAIGRAIER